MCMCGTSSSAPWNCAAACSSKGCRAATSPGCRRAAIRSAWPSPCCGPSWDGCRSPSWASAWCSGKAATCRCPIWALLCAAWGSPDRRRWFFYGLLVAPALLRPGGPLSRVEKGPGDEATLFLSLGHVDRAHRLCTGLLQRGMHAGQIGGLGNQGAEPEHLIRHPGAVLDQLTDEGRFATLAPEFGEIGRASG